MRVVQVDIHGQQYAIRSELDPQYIAEIAAYLDEKMRLAARELASSDPVRVAIIAALNIVDELHRAKADTTGVEGRFLARAADIERILDAVLTDSGDHTIGNVKSAIG
jgi:cell division protein ZapA (FtsZ GTPase activity inhibitor)